MPEVKWIKMYVNLLDDDKMIALESMPDGTTMELVWFKLLCLAGRCNCNGFLYFTEDVPYTEQMMARKFRVDIDAVRRSLEVFQKLNMIEIINDVCRVSNWETYQSNDRLEEIRRRDRERKQIAKEKSNAISMENKPTTTEASGSAPKGTTDIFRYANTNVKNLECVLNNSEEYKYILGNDRLLNILKDWMSYKDERKPKVNNHYGSERGIKALITRFLKCEKDYGMDVVEELVNNSIANNWQGVMWDRADRAKKNGTAQKTKKQLYIPPILTD